MIGFAAVMRAFYVAVRRLMDEPESRGLLLLVGALVGGGAIFYRNVEGLSWLDSFYFTIITLTTVGYGDITPATAAGKVFTMAYLLIGVGLLVTFVSQVASQMVNARAEVTRTRRKRRDAGE